MEKRIHSKTPIAAALSVILLQGSALAYESPVHVFSIDDVMGGFDGSTFGTSGATQDRSIICDLGDTPCPADNQPFIDKSGVRLYPVDSEFGYYVVDFLGAQGKVRDGDYMEGFVGNIVGGGIQVSNAPTLKYKAKPPLGTWCQGLGGTSVKCETEHYTVMEHVLSCHEIIPYRFADEDTGEQGVLQTPDGSLTFDCANAPLDDNTLILVDGAPTTRLTDATPCEDVNDPAGCQMFPNDKTDMLNNIALSTDYSVQLKDDGKPLYGWGGVHKRPNDVRLYAKLELPEEWNSDAAPAGGYTVTRAELVVNHWITNNPNDQLRPEDLENEAATGRKPSYRIEGTPGGADEVWRSTVPCYEGDGDFIEGETPATEIGAGTVLRNMPFALDPAATPGDLPADDPYAFSSDLAGAFTNAYYTTINRDPFEWSYDADPDPLVQDFVGSPVPDDSLGELVSGPRWRLKPNKFGQDLPGLEIPLIECSEPPFQSDNKKYVTGTPTTTVINLLDWDESRGPSPLSTSEGWVDVTANNFVEVAGTDPSTGIPYTTNGLPMTDGFDLAVYIKGDSKSTAVYDAQLIIEYDETEPPPTELFDLEMTSIPNKPTKVYYGDDSTISALVTNNGPGIASGTVTVTGVSVWTDYEEWFTGTVDFTDLASGDTFEHVWDWTAPDFYTSIEWTATVTSSEPDTDPSNDTLTGIRTKVREEP